MPSIQLNLISQNTVEINVERLIIAGWAGRNIEAIEEHIKELEELGVKRPNSVPCFYQVSTDLLTTENNIQVIEQNSSGEVECVLINSDYGLLIAIGSDHTDRKVESYNVAVSKQVCAKPLSSDAWLYSDVQNHWDDLIMRSYRIINGEKELYQQGSTQNLLNLPDLIQKLTHTQEFPKNHAMFCGTQAVLTQIAHGDEFTLELHDPILNRTLSHHYTVTTLDMVE
ncbi:hypothetical protein B9T31_02590 [Acinetobacter sp. ANC 4558]|uniref:DUF2848 domain-containing protein n=1 Tax=Acinetobacter sp. ANC 4558 TaxID=1977876 RepID=UPI000A351AEA|nr:DUF2848 domain-containing protein [Acinetobacter sp. ANC 4558]OTG87410.1 hypothetical protein B9T31_02590 [Acinetobacter sp. ANC 4558]